MTVLDERTQTPSLDGPTLSRLACALDREGIVAAMLIGSQARNTAGPLSDVDVAVWHEGQLDAGTRLRLQLELTRAASDALGSEAVDVVMLNEASPLMRHRAVRDGRRLVDRNPRTRVRLEARSILDYLDTAPLRAELARGQRHRIEENRFGRRREH